MIGPGFLNQVPTLAPKLSQFQVGSAENELVSELSYLSPRENSKSPSEGPSGLLYRGRLRGSFKGSFKAAGYGNGVPERSSFEGSFHGHWKDTRRLQKKSCCNGPTLPKALV